ncbi:hypothetical protein SAMN05421773_109228 [Streptomyces aidingensis]|uniref:Uncharacterized protein n=1 Tax=Streptomyces aidingensis TaxID=910347 RepID=A0A1I1PQN3_9ACTN|nr:hypothetical protein SAMN05421773_1077 [Streptomyces aidingensis]SFD09948.1 hypothetical protein SAMN05421773_109228 [Streptomyces aidingensis]
MQGGQCGPGGLRGAGRVQVCGQVEFGAQRGEEALGGGFVGVGGPGGSGIRWWGCRRCSMRCGQAGWRPVWARRCKSGCRCGRRLRGEAGQGEGAGGRAGMPVRSEGRIWTVAALTSGQVRLVDEDGAVMAMLLSLLFAGSGVRGDGRARGGADAAAGVAGVAAGFGAGAGAGPGAACAGGGDRSARPSARTGNWLPGLGTPRRHDDAGPPSRWGDRGRRTRLVERAAHVRRGKVAGGCVPSGGGSAVLLLRDTAGRVLRRQPLGTCGAGAPLVLDAGAGRTGCRAPGGVL